MRFRLDCSFLADSLLAPDRARRTAFPRNRSRCCRWKIFLKRRGTHILPRVSGEIVTRLAKVADLKVISRTSTHRYKSSPEDLSKIAQQLGVAHILEGSVQKTGVQVRVTVQLIRAATDSHLWAETYDRKLTDIFAVESEIAENIAKSLQARLTGTEQQAVAAKPTENPEAYEAYLRGLALWNKVQTSPQDFETTVLYFSRAVQWNRSLPSPGRICASRIPSHTPKSIAAPGTSRRRKKHSTPRCVSHRIGRHAICPRSVSLSRAWGL